MYIEITKVNDNFKSVENHLKDFQDKMKYEVGDLQTRVETVESQRQSTQKEPYDADITVVMTGLWYCETEKNIGESPVSSTWWLAGNATGGAHYAHSTQRREARDRISISGCQSARPESHEQALRKLSVQTGVCEVITDTHRECYIRTQWQSWRKWGWTRNPDLPVADAYLWSQLHHTLMTFTANLLHQIRPANLFHLKDARLSKPICRFLFIPMQTTRVTKISTRRIQLSRGMHHRSTLATSRAWCRCLTIPHTHTIIQVRRTLALTRRRWLRQQTLHLKISNLQYNSRPNPLQLARLSTPNPVV